MGETIEAALRRAARAAASTTTRSTCSARRRSRAADAARYSRAYRRRDRSDRRGARDPRSRARATGISVKLSALHPRYERAAARACIGRARRGCSSSRSARTLRRIGADGRRRGSRPARAVARRSSRASFDEPRSPAGRLGLAVQAYQKRAPPCSTGSRRSRARRPAHPVVRLVKGAYWDTEIKRAQELGLDGYPVFTRKAHTDVSYLACAQRAARRRATHLSRSSRRTTRTRSRAVLEFARATARSSSSGCTAWAKSCTTGSLARAGVDAPCRVYAPVGSHEICCRTSCAGCSRTAPTRRSCISSCDADVAIANRSSPIPRERRRAALGDAPHPRIPLPRELFAPRAPQFARRRSRRRVELVAARQRARADAARHVARRADRSRGRDARGARTRRPQSRRPSPRRRHGRSTRRRRSHARALDAASAAQPTGTRRRRESAPRCLERAADLLEATRGRARRAAACARPADRCRQRSPRCARPSISAATTRRRRASCSRAGALARPDRRAQRARARGRGVFVCISPWNFPLAIFTGQVAAALAAGNAVHREARRADAARRARAVQLLHEAGVPRDALQFVPGDGDAARRGAASPIRASRASSSPARSRRAQRDQPRARRARRPIAAAHRRDRRSERDDRR